MKKPAARAGNVIKKQMEALNFNVKDFNEKLNIKKFKELDVD